MADKNSDQDTEDLKARIASALEPVLPKDQNFSLIHVRSLPQKCRKLVFTSKHDTRLDALTTHYFVLISEGLAILAIELFAFESVSNCTWFVSKADTSGHYNGSQPLNMLRITQALLKLVLKFYSPPKKRVRVCLFAKADSQYLLLGSLKNPRKHVLSDAQLVKWWIKCLDGLAPQLEPGSEHKARLSVPGIDDNVHAIASYFPPESQLSWLAGDIFGDSISVADPAESDTIQVKRAVNVIPRFPDDPKSRFLDSIVAEKRAKVVTKNQFWIELQSRQEFRLGKSVGIIGLDAMLNAELQADLSKQSASTQHDVHKFKSLLLSLNFESVESTKHATERLVSSVPEHSIYELVGKQEKTQTHRPNLARPIINTLNTSLLKKKRKT